jgi:hypothetical protein
MHPSLPEIEKWRTEITGILGHAASSLLTSYRVISGDFLHVNRLLMVG